MYEYRIARRIGALLTTTILSGAFYLPAIEAVAQSAAAEQQYAFGIAAKSVPQGLNEIGRVAGFSVVLSGGTASSTRGRSVSGILTARQALSALLAGTGLTYSFTNANTVTVFDPNAGVQGGYMDGGETIQLETIDVSGQGGAGAPPQDVPYETPGSTSYISSEQIDRVPPNSPGDIFKSIPGVISAGNRTSNSLNVNIRGLQGSNRVRVMVDGTQQNTSTYRGYRGNDDRTSVDADLISSVTVEKGPSSGPYGSGAMGGVVNMQTLTAADIVKDGETYGFRVKAGLGSNTVAVPSLFSTSGPSAPSVPATSVYPAGPALTHIDERESPDFFNGESRNGSAAAGFINETFELVAAVAQRTSGNYFAGKEGSTTGPIYVGQNNYQDRPLSIYGAGKEVFNTSQDTTSALVKGKVKFGDGHSLELGYLHYESEYGEANEDYFVSKPPYQERLSEGESNTYTAKYRWAPEGNGLIDLHANIWMSDVRLNPWVNFRATPESLTSDTRTTGGELWNESRFDTAFGGLGLRYGLQYTHEDSESDELISARADDFGDVWVTQLSWNPTGKRETGGVFVDGEIQITDWLTLGGGLRYDGYRTSGGNPEFEALRPLDAVAPEREGSRVNPSVSVTVSPLDGWQLFGKYASGWRPPSIREATLYMAGSMPESAVLAPNLNLRPETSDNFEFGTNLLKNSVFVAGDTLRMKIAYFDNVYDDYIMRMSGAPEGVSATYTFGNIDAAKFRGIEFSGSYDAGWIFADAAVNYYTDIQYCIAGSPCSNSTGRYDFGSNYVPPEYTVNLALGTRLLDEALTLGTRVTIVGERAAEDYNLNFMTLGAIRWNPYTLVDLFGSYNINEDVSINFSAENIFDRYYIDALANADIPSPGRTIRAGLTARF